MERNGWDVTVNCSSLPHMRWTWPNMWINRQNILLYPHYCVSCIKCASHLYCTQRERWRTVEKCGGTISIRWPSNVSSFATVSPAHVRFTEHGSMPSCLPARRLLARRVREWRMRWHLHVSVCSLMTQRSFLPRRPSLSSLLCSLSQTFSGHLVCLLAAQLIRLGSYPGLILLLADSSVHHFPLWICQKRHI